MGDMADLVRDDAGEFVGVCAIADQPLEHVDVSARQCNGVGLAPADDRGLERDRQPGRRLEPADQRIERGAAGSFPRRPCRIRTACRNCLVSSMARTWASTATPEPLLDATAGSAARSGRAAPARRRRRPARARRWRQRSRPTTRLRRRALGRAGAVEAVGAFVDLGDQARDRGFRAAPAPGRRRGASRSTSSGADMRSQLGRRASARSAAPSAPRMRSASGAASTVTAWRALVVPSK